MWYVKKREVPTYEVYNDKAVGLMAVMAILLCLSGLIWYQYGAEADGVAVDVNSLVSI